MISPLTFLPVSAKERAVSSRSKAKRFPETLIEVEVAELSTSAMLPTTGAISVGVGEGTDGGAGAGAVCVGGLI